MTRYLGTCILALLTFAANVGWAQEEATEKVTYYAVLLNGQKIGHCVNTRRVEEGTVTNISEQTMTMGRGDGQLLRYTRVESVETFDGTPLSFKHRLQDGQTITRTVEGTVEDGQIHATIQGPAGEEDITMPWPEGAVMDEGELLLAKRMGLAEGTTYTINMFDEEELVGIPVRTRVGPREEVDLLGRVVSLIRVEGQVDTNAGSITMIAHATDNYDMLKGTTLMAGMALEIVACDQAFAESPDQVIDFVADCLIETPVSIPADARDALTFVLEPAPDSDFQLP